MLINIIKALGSYILMKAFHHLKHLRNLFERQTKPFDWTDLHTQVDTDIQRLNTALERIGSIARFSVVSKATGLEIYLNNQDYSPENYAAHPYRGSTPEIGVCLDGSGKKFGLSLKFTSGPRPAGLTVQSLKAHQVMGEIRKNITLSLNYSDGCKLRSLQAEKFFTKDFVLQ